MVCWISWKSPALSAKFGNGLPNQDDKGIDLQKTSRFFTSPLPPENVGLIIVRGYFGRSLKQWWLQWLRGTSAQPLVVRVVEEVWGGLRN